MRATHFIGALAVLAFALNVTAADRPITGKGIQLMPPDYHGGAVLPPGPVNDTMTPANNCDDPHPAGVLAVLGGSLVGDTLGAGDDFHASVAIKVKSFAAPDVV